ncbi:glycosyltransferase family 39 protein [Ancylobacter pratisalsi]|uniref:Glycosyltransferase RgtA/B/C/D-like domain-containing protein n=1 Tax=Ancylobacter pratisalsi TaxID=1745854 RepID=A0A6P1YT07_9HYPH|nr:glycosyltransferase family 39 protein [Ancylobacter pratisalsi]QIB35836.1 hypothetical protein G3A50_20565 [Ancylobacter pratisalsi]
MDRDAAFGLRVMQLALIGLCVYAAYILFIGLTFPIVDNFYFRQTQTALTTYWLLQGGPWFAYETPVLGAPWAIPFEFPVFQLIVAGVGALGVPLDAAGRLVNFLFFIATLWPLALLFRTLQLSRASYLATAILFVASPLYLYWSRTFLIESCALFFALFWLTLLVRYLAGGGLACVIGAIVAGTLAVLAKATTFPAFALLGALYALWILAGRLRSGESYSRLLAAVFVIGCIGLVPLAIGTVWVAYSDHVKMANQFGAMMTSSSLAKWNFGTLDQRLTARLWNEVLIGRMAPDILGYFFVVGVLLVGVGLVAPRRRWAVLAAILGFFTPILLFFNVHMVHSYYQVANAIFLLAAVGLGVGSLFENGHPRIALLGLAVLAGGQIAFFNASYRPVIKAEQVPIQDRLLRIGLVARENTRPDQSLIVIGDDWSSAIPYYAQRKSLAVGGWFPRPLVEHVVTDPQSLLGDRPLGGIVYCADMLPGFGDNQKLITDFVARRAVIGAYGGCQLLSPQQGP